MIKRALLVGINNYDNADNLTCCVDDANAMEERLRKHADGAPNFDCLTLTSDRGAVTEAKLRQSVARLFAELRGGDAVFYFSGHGVAAEDGGFLLTQEAKPGEQGYAMAELLEAANEAGVGSILLILDCCHSGTLGNTGGDEDKRHATIGEGVTILAASTEQQEAQEGLEHSLFTDLVLGALDGGAANIRGEVTAAAIYGYVEQSLSFWQQRPMYKSHARQLTPIRRCGAQVSDEVLRQLPELFKVPFVKVAMDPSFEHTEQNAVSENVEKFNLFKSLRNAGLLTTEDNLDLYYVALESKSVFLTPLGKFYWKLVRNNRI